MKILNINLGQGHTLAQPPRLAFKARGISLTIRSLQSVRGSVRVCVWCRCLLDFAVWLLVLAVCVSRRSGSVFSGGSPDKSLICILG
jgi:hypothetical protein